MMELLSEVSVRPDRAVIVVTHDSRVFEFADTIAHMEDGRITGIEQNESPSARNGTDSLRASGLRVALAAR